MAKNAWVKLVQRSLVATGAGVTANNVYRFVKEANEPTAEERWEKGDRLALKNIKTHQPGKGW